MKSRKVLFAGYDFLEEVQRGIYQYSKSLISATSAAGYDTGILTQIPFNDSPVMASEIYQFFKYPNTRNFPRSRKKILKQYIKYRLGITQEQFILNKEILTDESFWFLKDINFFLNIPAMYYMTFLQQKLRLDKSSLVLDQNNLKGNDIVFTTSPLNIKTKTCKLVQTVHDLIPIQVQFHNDSPTRFYKRLDACANATKVLAVSNYSRNQFLEYFPRAEDKTKVVYQPIPTDTHILQLSTLPSVQASVLSKYGLKKNSYMYYVGAVEARKNIHNLIQGHQIATNNNMEMPLVISGGIDEAYVKEYKLSKFLKPVSLLSKERDKQENVFKTDYVSELEKLCLIRNSRAFLFPTLNEGFGIPVLEAQTLGAPVLTTNCSSIPEVVHESAYLIEDPFNVEEIANGIKRLLEDDDLCRDLSEKGLKNAERFSKENFRQNIADFLKDI